MQGIVKYTISIIFLICLLQISFYTERHEFATMFATYAVFFVAYLYVLKNVKLEYRLNLYFT